MTNETKDELLRCPFCGGDASHSEDGSGDYVECLSCGVIMANSSYSSSMELWNKRAHHWKELPTIADYVDMEDL